MKRTRWPFANEQAFWGWAMDPDAVLAEQDEDLHLHDAVGLDLLRAAAERSSCPRQRYCCRVLEDYAAGLVKGSDVDALAALHAVAARAARGTQPHTRRWAAYVERLLSYREPHGPVNRTRAEQMAADLLSGPSLQEVMVQAGRPNWLIVQVTANGKHWQCTRPDSYPTFLYINRRSGSWRPSAMRPLPPDELAAL